MARKEVGSLWSSKSRNDMNDNFTELYERKITSADINTTTPKGPDALSSEYGIGVSIFYDTQDTESGLQWIDSLGQSYSGGLRVMVETIKDKNATIQRINIIRTSPATYEVLGTFIRSAYGNNSWGPWSKIDAPKSIVNIPSGTELYNPNAAKVGRYYRYSTGELVLINVVSCSDFISVYPGSTYRKNVAGHVAFFDENFKYVYGINVQNAPADIKVTKPEVRWVSFSFNTNDVDIASWKYISGETDTSIIDEKRLIIPRLDELEQSKNLRLANSKVFLKLPTPYDDGTEWEGRLHQATHPSITQFDTEWNGYKYWMAFTPYVGARLSTENPCVVASNDGVKWIVPAGVTNPLDNAPVGGYNSDSHILFNSSTNKLEIWYRAVTENSSVETLKRVTSADGSSWSTPETMLESRGAANILQYIAPSVIYENGKYRMWVMRDYFIYVMESGNGKNWSNSTLINAGGDYIHSWHGNVQKYGDVYYLLNCDKLNNKGKGGELFFYTSHDGVNWSKGKKVITYTGNDWDYDGHGVYRGALLFKDESIHIYYGMYVKDEVGQKWTIGLSTGRDTDNLMGIDQRALEFYNA
ncbi:hypothetical protein [Bacillus cereus]|uniref:hypothetical protein n=1 Tax=Bacillus cereus TaxID=1396 RepID=UPI000BFA3357|nr:hypothetical protein [Bacillus cereus]PFI24060.1 hypothetical protein COI75_13720 [Bacillus cereus]